MSSYFDTMSSCLRSPEEIVELVYTQYRWYLIKLSQECLVRDLDKLNRLIMEFDEIDCKKDPYWVLQEFHDFAHKLANERIRLRGGRVAMDNPPIPY